MDAADPDHLFTELFRNEGMYDQSAVFGCFGNNFANPGFTAHLTPENDVGNGPRKLRQGGLQGLLGSSAGTVGNNVNFKHVGSFLQVWRMPWNFNLSVPANGSIKLTLFSLPVMG